MSMWFNLDDKRRIYERTTYSFLDWLGDVGGLFDGLVLFSRWFISPFVIFSLRSKLLSYLFVEQDEEDRPVSFTRKAKKYGHISCFKTLLQWDGNNRRKIA